MAKTLGKSAAPQAPKRAAAATLSQIGAAPDEPASFQTTTDGFKAATLPKVQPSAPFIFAWHPARWVVMEGRLVPSLRKVQLIPGLNDVRRTKDGRYDLGATRARLERKGWRLLPQETGPNGSYIKRARVEGNDAYAHLSVWESVYAGSDQIGSDGEGYATWLDGLVRQGVIQPCPPHVASTLRDQHQTTCNAYQEKILRGHVAYKAHADRLVADMAVIDAYLEQQRPVQDGPPAPSEDVDLNDLTGAV